MRKLRKYGRFLAILAAMALLLSVLAAPAAAAPVSAPAKSKIIIKAGSAYMTLDGAKKELDPGKGTAAAVVSGVFLAPVKAVVEAMGGKVTVASKEGKTDITLGSCHIQAWTGKRSAIVNGKTVQLPIAPRLAKGRIIIPLKFVVDNLKAAYSWNAKTKEATILFTKPASGNAGSASGSKGQASGSTGVEGPASLNDNSLLVINDFALTKGDFKVKDVAGDTFIFVVLDKFKYAFKYPYAGNYNFPEVYEEDGTIYAAWKDSKEQVYLEVTMQVGSAQATVNGGALDVKAGPYRDGDKVMVPVNLFAEALKMKVAAFGGRVYIETGEDFPQNLLKGSWYDSDMNVFMGVEDLTTGAVELPSYASSYTFNTDGTYRMGIISTGLNDTLVTQSGKYKVIGNTVICYEIKETVYRGRPFQLKYKDLAKDAPEYLFLDNYDTEKDELEICGFWHHRPDKAE